MKISEREETETEREPTLCVCQYYIRRRRRRRPNLATLGTSKQVTRLTSASF